MPLTLVSRRLLPLLAFLTVVLAGCSESFTASILHFCPDALVVTSAETGYAEEFTTVDPSTPTVVWSYCCAPGENGLVVFSSGEWQMAVEFDAIRQEDVIEIPASACSTASAQT